ncbi:hypothetical protein IWZ03DRAFT_142611 [Phyllosticta citriasiana]|uniref:Uncharacterized protein n=1 Tax=Phyllosticta citriasiana TaxID=595635 RepID=A0ABR1KSV3_9PEZI
MSTRSASGAWTLSCHTARASSIETDCSPYSHVKRPNASLLFSSFGGGCFLRVCVLMCFKIYCSHPLLLSPRATACRHKPHLILTGRCKMQNEFCTRRSQAPLQYNHRFDRPWMLQALQAFVLQDSNPSLANNSRIAAVTINLNAALSWNTPPVSAFHGG